MTMLQCDKGERIARLETQNIQIIKGQDELMSVCSKTFEALTVLGGQGRQIEFLNLGVGQLKLDVEVAFKSIRRIDLRHERIDGADEVTDAAEEKRERFWEKFWDKVCTREMLMTVLFIWWISDKFHVPTKIASLMIEFTGGR